MSPTIISAILLVIGLGLTLGFGIHLGKAAVASRSWWKFAILFAGMVLMVAGSVWLAEALRTLLGSAIPHILISILIIGGAIAIFVVFLTKMNRNRRAAPPVDNPWYFWVFTIAGGIVAILALVWIIITLVKFPWSTAQPQSATNTFNVATCATKDAAGNVLLYPESITAGACAYANPTAGGSSLANPPANLGSNSNSITSDWFNQKVSNTNTVSQLLSELDREYNAQLGKIGGPWTQEDAESALGFTVPANSVFWTDLFENVRSLPEGVKVVRTQGGWGIYTTTVAFKIPLPNGGGRFANLVGTVADLPSTACLSDADLNNITGSSDPVKEFNKYFESAGYVYGASVEEGGTVPAGTIFLGTFPEASISAGLVNLSGGYIWEAEAAFVSPNGGRWVTYCGN